MSNNEQHYYITTFLKGNPIQIHNKVMVRAEERSLAEDAGRNLVEEYCEANNLEVTGFQCLTGTSQHITILFNATIKEN